MEIVPWTNRVVVLWADSAIKNPTRQASGLGGVQHVRGGSLVAHRGLAGEHLALEIFASDQSDFVKRNLDLDRDQVF